MQANEPLEAPANSFTGKKTGMPSFMATTLPDSNWMSLKDFSFLVTSGSSESAAPPPWKPATTTIDARGLACYSVTTLLDFLTTFHL